MVIFLASKAITRTPLVRSKLVAIELIAVPRVEQEIRNEVEQAVLAGKNPTPPKTEKMKAASQLPHKSVEPAVPPMEEAQPWVEVKPALQTKDTTSFSSAARVEGGGSEAGAGKLFGGGDIGVVPGAGTGGGGGGTAASGLGRGAGAPGLPGQSVLRTNREAKPIQTVRATYPPMALRMGMESDVILKIEVDDTEGKVTKAEIIKSGGAGFDEEALKAVKQSRFEPAQRDGHNVSAEFTYIYRFRLQR